jgi:hypothetical protein
MNQQNKSRHTDESVNPGQKIKRLAAQLTIGDGNLASEIKRMFDLAKSSGQELDLTFNPETT